MAAAEPHGLVRVAVPTPLRDGLDYLCPQGAAPGCRVVVPLGRRTVTGLVIETLSQTLVEPRRLRPVKAVLDECPVIGERLLRQLLWAAGYYQHPVGEVIKAALPGLLGGAAPRRAAPLAEPSAEPSAELSAALPPAADGALPGAVTLSTEQAQAAAAVCAAFGGFQGFVLHGITGSGKTEVYIAIIEQVIRAGKQALVLAPEISLTPQLVERFEKHLGKVVGVLHSRLAPARRRDTWERVRAGRLPVVLGTRSAVFAPLPRPGVIVVDEEHDVSYKQQDGFRYHARDMAVLRARDEQVPVVLGSATPSLETLLNLENKRYRELLLPVRAGAAVLPRVRLLDTRSMPVTDGLTPVLAQAVAARLERGEQSLLYINRRGFAPVLLCTDCGWQAQCRECDANLVLHRRQVLLCHHCGARAPEPQHCPECQSSPLQRVGHGTQRLEEALARRFPEAAIERLDRDSTGRRGALEQKLANVRSGRADVLVGTRMLCKGHDFPGLSLVGVIDLDRGFYSADFRALEYQVQQLLQVAGRAGRAGVPGEVLIQTAFPENPYLRMVATHDFKRFAATALAERRSAGFPPYSRFVLMRVEAAALKEALDFLHWIKRRAARHLPGGGNIRLMDPVPSPMERRQGRYRAQLLVQGGKEDAGGLQSFLGAWIRDFETAPHSRRVRWSVDVDPMEMF